MSGLTTRWKLPYPGLSDGPDGADVPYWMQALAVALDGVAMDDQGVLASRPVSTPASPGKKGRYYMATDSTPATLYRDNGTGWDAVGTVQPGSVGTAALADGAVTTPKLADQAATAAKLADQAVTAAKIAAGVVDATKIADALKPSAGAGGAVEALRALGTAAGTAAAGAHASQHTPTGADPILGLRKYAMGMSITVPVAGSYWVVIGCAGQNFGSAQNIKLDLTAGGITLSAYGGGGGGGTEGLLGSPHDEGLMTGLTAGQVLTMTSDGNVGPTKPYMIIERMA